MEANGKWKLIGMEGGKSQARADVKARCMQPWVDGTKGVSQRHLTRDVNVLQTHLENQLIYLSLGRFSAFLNSSRCPLLQVAVHISTQTVH